jgi:acetylornithine deacetylase
LRVKVKVQGKACHSAYPEQGDSAIHRLLRGLERVLAADFGHDPVLGPATVNVGQIAGGVAANVLAPSAEAVIAIRVIGPMAAVESTLVRCFTDRSTGALDPHVEFIDAHKIDPPSLERVEGYPETVVAYGTDIPALKDVGKHVLYGPGSILNAHTQHERIRKREILDAVDAYVDIVEKLLRRVRSPA